MKKARKRKLPRVTFSRKPDGRLVMAGFATKSELRTRRWDIEFWHRLGPGYCLATSLDMALEYALANGYTEADLRLKGAAGGFQRRRRALSDHRRTGVLLPRRAKVHERP